MSVSQRPEKKQKRVAETMKAVRKLKEAKGFELVDVPIPQPASDQVLIKVLAASLCGTDVHVHDWDPPFCEGRLTPPITTGHEVCGQVIAVGSDVKELQIGDLVSAESHIPCASQKNLKLNKVDSESKAEELCEMCKMGNGHICQRVKFFSVDVDGFLAEYAVAPANILWKNPAKMKWETASLQESLGNSVYTVEASNVKDKDVAVFGLGPTGLNAVAVARFMGAKQVFAIAGTEKHIELAKKMGATTVINRHKALEEGSSIVEQLKKLTNGRGPHVCLEMSGHAEALDQCLDSVMTTGQVSILGLYSKPLTIDLSKKVVLKDVTVRGIYGRKIWDTWKLTSQLLTEGLDISPVVTHRFEGLSDWQSGFSAMKSGACGKCVFFPHGFPAST